jgi:hypothetical protein
LFPHRSKGKYSLYRDINCFETKKQNVHEKSGLVPLR